MHLIDFEKITIEFKCRECCDKVEVTLNNVLGAGTPWCSNCDCEYDAAGSTAAVQTD